MHILLAEDHALCRMAYAEMLEMCGATVTAVRDGAEAVDACRAGLYDVVLLDRYMDGLDGPRAAAEIRRVSPKTSLILLSAEHDIGTGIFDAVMTKPLQIDRLERLVKNML